MVVDELHDEDEGERAVTAEIDSSALDADILRTRSKRAMLVVLSGQSVGTIVPLDISEITIGRDPGCDVRLGDDGISRRHVRVLADGPRWAVEDVGSTNGTTVNGERLVGRHELQEGDRVLVGHTVLKFVRQAEVDAEYQAKVYEMSVRDPLTRLYNRRFFDDRLRSEVAYARRHRSLLALLMMDLDHFKEVNDGHGHLAGDRVLMEISALLRAQVRSEDVLARFGGEEFAVLVRGIQPPGVVVLAERIRRAVEGLRIEGFGQTLGVTISIGSATVQGDAALSEQGLVDAADRLLYRAKSSGRNRTCAESW
ncbi:MAG: diguanylate cyclase [Deltaproteobacteria bacterium]|nr:diguanylate cyclase [Deltaproteobacteria bacterium]